MGDGSFDPKLYRPDSTPTFIPPYLAYVDPWMAETAADNRYVTVDGNDDVPDLLIGRLPVKTLAGKLELASTGQNLDLLNTFVLLGDPATRFDRTVVPWAAQLYLPAVLWN